MEKRRLEPKQLFGFHNMTESQRHKKSGKSSQEARTRERFIFCSKKRQLANCKIISDFTQCISVGEDDLWGWRVRKVDCILGNKNEGPKFLLFLNGICFNSSFIILPRFPLILSYSSNGLVSLTSHVIMLWFSAIFKYVVVMGFLFFHV